MVLEFKPRRAATGYAFPALNADRPRCDPLGDRTEPPSRRARGNLPRVRLER